MTDQELKDLVASLAIDRKAMEADTKVMKADTKAMKADTKAMKASTEAMQTQVKANDEKLARMGFRLGSIQQNNGDIAEEYFYKSIEHTMKLGDVSFDFIDRNLFRYIKKSNIKGEYDMILVNGSTVAFIETKYKMHENDVIKIKEKLLPKFKALFPEYKDYKLFAGVASFHINKQAKDLAKDFGFYVLEKVGDVLQTNDTHIKAY